MPLPACHCGRNARSRLIVCIFLALGLAFVPARAEQKHLQLEVFINEQPTKLIGSFIELADGRIGATRTNLEGIGLQVNPRHQPTDLVTLDEVAELRYRYDERNQKIYLSTAPSALRERRYDLSGANVQPVQPRADWGALLNYNVLASSGSLLRGETTSGASASTILEGRLFSQYGTFEQSGIVRHINGGPTEAIRLETSYRYSDPGRMITYRLGDSINSALPWSRPIRFAGAQAQSNFALRPDLITIPLPSLGGTAAVPSTVDIYVNNIKTLSQDVGVGPFNITNIPLITGSGDAQMVIRDASGQERRTTVPFYASARLLAPGITSWSVEGGLPRLSFGSTDDTYLSSPMASATLRRGIFDWLTLEGRAEATAGLANGGVGAVLRTGTFGVASAALSASKSREGTGFQTYLSFETRLFGLNFSATSQRTFGTYDDLASVTANLRQAVAGNPQKVLGFLNFTQPATVIGTLPSLYVNARPPRAIERVSISAPLPFDSRSGVSLSFLRLEDGGGKTANIASLTYTRSLMFNASFFASAFHDFSRQGNTGIFAGLTMPLGRNLHASSIASRGSGGMSGGIDIVRTMPPEPGSYGWRVRATQGDSPVREAAASYRSSYGTVQAGLRQTAEGVHVMGDLRGSIATMGGGVFFSDWIDDSFAVVSTGAPGMRVFSENQPVGTTDSRGMLLVPNLRSYQNNKILVDPTNLPIDATMVSTQEVISPADRAGIMVRFARVDDTKSALVTFKRPNGSFVPPGAVGRAGQSEFTVGHDGLAFVRDLQDANTVSIEFIDGQCAASFAFRRSPGQQVRINDVICQ